jgi:ParB family chromosome partitioning protein
MVQNIPIEKLHPHPDNPRKDLGDLSELIESIKYRGVLQNLTVVKHEDDYRIVIGHRRFEAAKQAGLAELPCVVAEMDPKEQVATMLLENMQRCDLTVYEQAKGFQMMLDFGVSIADISEKTGFSQTTVRRRLKLLELDEDRFRESAKRNPTLMEYMELEQIEDISLRNEVLDHVGTPNFHCELQRALDRQKIDKRRAEIIAVLKTFAIEIEAPEAQFFHEAPEAQFFHPDYRHVASYYPFRDDEVKIPADAGEARYYFSVSPYGSVTLWSEKPSASEEDRDEEEKRERRKARYIALDEITERSYQLRKDFVRRTSNAAAKRHMSFIVERAIHAMMSRYACNVDPADMAILLDVTIVGNDEQALRDIQRAVASQPEKAILAATYCLLDEKHERYYDWHCDHRDNDDLDQVYEFLEVLGYEMSDEERAMQDGTHEVFGKGEPGNGQE